MQIKNPLKIFCDGGARGNPGPAAIGYSIIQNGREIKARGQYIGKATNNEAEYKAVLAALTWLEKNTKPSLYSIKIFLDSKLVVNQLNGLYKVKKAHLRALVLKVRNAEGALYSKKIAKEITYHHIPREQNKRADQLLNQALDKRSRFDF